MLAVVAVGGGRSNLLSPFIAGRSNPHAIQFSGYTKYISKYRTSMAAPRESRYQTPQKASHNAVTEGKNPIFTSPMKENNRLSNGLTPLLSSKNVSC